MKHADLTKTEDRKAINRENAWRDEKLKMPKDNTTRAYVDRSIFKRRSEEFQAGSNPVAMNQFEQMCVNQEKNSRQDARRNYIRGIQGRDGGNKCDNYELEFEDGPETN